MAKNGSSAGTAPWYRSSTTCVEVRKASRFRSVTVITEVRWVIVSRMLRAQHPQGDGDQRQREFATRCLRPGVQEIMNLGEQCGPFGLIHHQQVRVRRDGGQQGIGGARLPVPELSFLARVEQAGARLDQPVLPG